MKGREVTISKKDLEFTIISNDPTDGHGGFGGGGAFSLNNMTPVLIDVDAGEAEIDMALMHGRSKVERRVRFLHDKDAVPNGKPYWIVWVTVENGEDGPYYAGVSGCEMLVDREIRRGYKNFPDHVNKMDRSRKGYIIVDHMDDKSKRILQEFLKDFNQEMWDRSDEKLHKDLSV